MGRCANTEAISDYHAKLAEDERRLERADNEFDHVYKTYIDACLAGNEGDIEFLLAAHPNCENTVARTLAAMQRHMHAGNFGNAGDALKELYAELATAHALFRKNHILEGGE